MIPGEPRTLPVPATGGARPQVTGKPAAAGRAGPIPSTYAEVLCQIARLVDDGVTPPPTISCDSRGQVVAHIRRDDLPTWVVHLDLPAPDWNTVEIGDELVTFASWPLAVTDSLPFRLTCIESRAINPNAAALCRDCSALDFRPCNPGCRA